MSADAVNQFLIKVIEEQELQVELSEAIGSEQDREAVTKLANKYGFSFTPEELGNRIETALDQGELKEEELEAIAGGRLDIGDPAVRKEYKINSITDW